MAFKENLRYYREKAGFTAKEFAAMLGLKYTTYAAYENQKSEPKFEILRKIADLLHVSIDKLLDHETGDSYEHCKNLIESFKHEYMDVVEEDDGTICIIVNDGNDTSCSFQSKKDFIDCVLKWEQEFVGTWHYKMFFNLHFYEHVREASDLELRNNDTLSYIEESLDNMIYNSSDNEREKLKPILMNALKSLADLNNND